MLNNDNKKENKIHFGLIENKNENEKSEKNEKIAKKEETQKEESKKENNEKNIYILKKRKVKLIKLLIKMI